MNKLMKKIMALGILFLAFGICCGEALASSASSPDNNIRGQAGKAGSSAVEQTDGAAPVVGRDDPFAGSFGGDTSEIQSSIPISGQPVISKPPLFVRTVTLKFLSAANLKTALDKMSSEHGIVGVDESTNSLIICDTKDNLDKILTEVKKADQTPQQIMIEVVIIDVKLGDDTEIGVDWDLLSNKVYNFGYRQSMIFPDRLFHADANLTGGTAFMTTGGLGGEVSIVNRTVRNVVHLLQQTRNVDILASPRVMVVSGKKAEIKTVEEIPYQQLTQTSAGGGGASAITSTEFRDVGVTMEVKATVTDDGKIVLEIKPEQSVTTGTSIGGVPVIDKRQASTTLLMDDGQVVVMGGLRRQDTQIINYKVPILGDLPLVGFIFSDNRKIMSNSELLVLLSPHIYKGEPVPADAMARFNQIKNSPTLSLPDESKSQPSKQNKK